MQIKTVVIERKKVSQKGKILFLGKGGKNLFAEQAALEDYKERGYNGFWSENNFWWEIMALLFWDTIFASVKGAVSISRGGIIQELEPDDPLFQKLFQAMMQMNGMPADFFTPNFYKRREDLIKKRIAELGGTNIVKELEESYKQHRGKKCRPIEQWNKFTLDQLSMGASCLKFKQLIMLLQNLLEDFKDSRRGLPDLFLCQKGYPLFVEVKVNDKLSVQQENWINFISKRLKIKVELCVIKEIKKK